MSECCKPFHLFMLQLDCTNIIMYGDEERPFMDPIKDGFHSRLVVETGEHNRSKQLQQHKQKKLSILRWVNLVQNSFKGKIESFFLEYGKFVVR